MVALSCELELDIGFHFVSIFRRNIKSKAVICENCFLWTHYRCLGKTEEQIKREFPDQFVCKECTDKKVEEEQSKDKKAKKVSITCKRDTALQEDKHTEKEKLEEQIKNLKKQNKELREKLKESKEEIELKDKQLNDRRAEVTRLNKKVEDNRREINTLTYKHQIIEKQKEKIERTIENDKHDWNKELGELLEKEVENTQRVKKEMVDTSTKLQQQYIVVLEEKECLEREYKSNLEKAYAEIEKLKDNLEEEKFNSRMTEEKDEYIDLMEKRVDDLRKEKDNAENIVGRLEKELYEKEEERKRQEERTKKSNKSKEEEPQQNQTRSHTTRDERTKRCYACGDEDHLISECRTKKNIFVQFRGAKWINKTELERVFSRYGEIVAKHIKKDQDGQETKMAMICFRREEEAREAVKRMEKVEDWYVSYYKARKQNRYENEQQRSYTRERKDKQWTESRNRAEERETTEGKDNKKENEIEELKSEVFDIRTDIKSLSSNMEKLMAMMMKEA